MQESKRMALGDAECMHKVQALGSGERVESSEALEWLHAVQESKRMALGGAECMHKVQAFGSGERVESSEACNGCTMCSKKSHYASDCREESRQSVGLISSVASVRANWVTSKVSYFGQRCAIIPPYEAIEYLSGDLREAAAVGTEIIYRRGILSHPSHPFELIRQPPKFLTSANVVLLCTAPYEEIGVPCRETKEKQLGLEQNKIPPEGTLFLLKHPIKLIRQPLKYLIPPYASVRTVLKRAKINALSHR